jgi:hypothetical protein
MSSFCCNKFHFLYQGDKRMGLNIRVLQVDPVLAKEINLSSNKVVFLTEGYENSIDMCVKKIVINYCPFCGTSLSYLKKTDEYVQEIG